ncbi:MAG: hypothetical protein Q4G23_00095 [Clostridia bacterium]|nr:hypothetical protein [Clostridia bacterium]
MAGLGLFIAYILLEDEEMVVVVIAVICAIAAVMIYVVNNKSAKDNAVQSAEIGHMETENANIIHKSATDYINAAKSVCDKEENLSQYAAKSNAAKAENDAKTALEACAREKDKLKELLGTLNV